MAELKTIVEDVPGSPVVKTALHVQGGPDSIPSQVARIPHATWHGHKEIN